MSQKVRDIVIIVFGVTSGVNAIYQLISSRYRAVFYECDV